MSDKLDVDEVAVVIDNHTGRVKAHFMGFGAGADARSFLRSCQVGQRAQGFDPVDHLNSASIVTGEKAKKAIKDGRI